MQQYRYILTSIIGLCFIFSPVSAKELTNSTTIQPQANKILKRMSNYLDRLKQFSFNAEISLDTKSNAGEKFKLHRNVSISVSRPNQLKAMVRGDIHTLDFYYNGKTITLFNPKLNVYGIIKMHGNIESALNYAREKFYVQAPLAELIYKNS